MIEKMLTKIKIERIKKGYSQEYLSSILNISQSSYNKLENGKVEITLSTLFKIISILGLDHKELFVSHSNQSVISPKE